MLPLPQDEPPPEAWLPDEGQRPGRPLLALLAVLVAAAMVAAALGGYSFIGPDAPTPHPTPTPIPARTA